MFNRNILKSTYTFMLSNIIKNQMDEYGHER